MKLLVLEDDPRLQEAYAGRLRREGHDVEEVATLAEARVAIAATRFDLLVLDRLVPDGDAVELIEEVHVDPRRVPMLVLSALSEADERVLGLRAGADDYLPKPVRLDELALRVEKLAGRDADHDWGPVHLGQVVFDRHRHVVTAGGKDVKLTPHQYSVLDYLVAHRDRMVGTEELLEHCWDGDRSVFANPLHSQVTRLRRAFRGYLRFESVRGAGYVLHVLDPSAGGASGRRARRRPRRTEPRPKA